MLWNKSFQKTNWVSRDRGHKAQKTGLMPIGTADMHRYGRTMVCRSHVAMIWNQLDLC